MVSYLLSTGLWWITARLPLIDLLYSWTTFLLQFAFVSQAGLDSRQRQITVKIVSIDWWLTIVISWSRVTSLAYPWSSTFLFIRCSTVITATCRLNRSQWHSAIRWTTHKNSCLWDIRYYQWWPPLRPEHASPCKESTCVWYLVSWDRARCLPTF